MFQKTLNILVTPLNGHGHLNCCHGLCEQLRDRGHKITFVLDKAFKGRMSRYGFNEYLLEQPTKDQRKGYDNDKEFWPQFFNRNAKRLEESPVEQLDGGVIFEALTDMFEHLRQYTDQYEKALKILSPDLIITDGLICFPMVVNAKVPHVWMYSTSVQSMLLDPRIPPFFSGLPMNDKSEWASFTERAFRGLEPLRKRVSDANVAHGGKELPYGRLHHFSDFMNLFMQPKELRYPELTDLPDNIVGVDCFVRTVPDQKFEIPAQLLNKPGKLVFFSLGSHSTAHVELMKKICGILAKSPNRFIVSMGPILKVLPSDNLWGDKFLPQTAILPQVDLVISHGGNNTTTETFYFGKKILILPLFCDQFDNAQRVSELGLGARLNPHTMTEEELLSTIDRLLADEQLTERMAQIGKRMQREAIDQRTQVADLIEQKMFARLNSK